MKIHKLLLSFISMLITCPIVWSRDFQYTFKKQTLTYTVIDEENKTCATKGNQKVSGSLIIPPEAYDGSNFYTVTTIGANSFDGSSSLTDISFPNTILKIDEYAFNKCTSLTEVELPGSLAYIGENAFAKCSNLENLRLDESESMVELDGTDYRSYDYWRSKKTWADSNESKEYELEVYPGSVLTFSYKTAMSYMSDGLIVARFSISVDGKNLVSVNQKSTSGNCKYTFTRAGTAKLKVSWSVWKYSESTYSYGEIENIKLTVPWESKNDEVFIWNNAFDSSPVMTLCTGRNLSSNCIPFRSMVSLNNLTFLEKVTNIGTHSFEDCTDLEMVESKAKNPPIANDSTFSGAAYRYATLNVPAGSVDKYATSPGWKNFNTYEVAGPVLPAEITLNPQCMTLLMGQTRKINATIEPEDVTDKTIIWKSSNESVATVSADGTVTAVSVGVANITATCGEVSATCEVTVTLPAATGITLDKENYDGIVGDMFVLKANILPENAAQEVKWETSNADVATVSANGEVTLVAKGIAIITASTTDSSDLSAACEVSAWLRGDSNGDDTVNVADVVNSVNYIVGKPLNKFVFIATDMNGDKDITVTDATLIAQVILNSEVSYSALHKMTPMRSNIMGYNNYVNVTDNGSVVTLAVNNTGFSAYQSEIVLPEGAKLSRLELINGAKATHAVMSSINDNTVKLIVFSLDNAELTANEPFVKLVLDRKHDTIGTVVVNGAVAADASANSYALIARVNGQSSGVDSIGYNTEISVEAQQDGVIIRGAEDMPVMIFGADGMLIHSGKSSSDYEYILLNKGIYIVRIEDMVKSIYVR